ncbi:type IV pilus biogenesis/stability protein PilW [Catenovulum agarivorans DS-2]|uniref:Type IV pilus biogenesis/stability protein PilW n=1 Tax=Catenovulum agarivorans DS-2 TaxID=1328313 RepID=W7QKA5_9ALTE|nr:type IV pilus biogenesis/stability protein PilW [Catenovulum agarivorans]EWH12346.1 type IV pilus biogenesis/stability protein PilW [Catenovulum agarivorans DS-2]
MLKWFKQAFIITISAALIAGCVSQKTYVGSDKPVVEKQSTPVEAAKNRIALGLTYLKKGNAAQAKFNLDKALGFAPDLPEAHYSLAYYYQVVGEIEKADAAYKRVVSLDRKNGDALNNYGAFLCQQGKYQQAKEHFLQAVAIDSYIRVAQTYENLGLCLYDSGEEKYRDEVEKYLISALGYNARLPKSLSTLVELNLANNNLQAAYGYVKKLELLQQNNPATIYRAYQLAEQLGDHKGASSYARRLFIDFPKSPQTQQLRQALTQ